MMATITSFFIANDRSLVIQQALFLLEIILVGYLICLVAYRTGEADIIPWAFFIGSVIISVYMLSGNAVLVGRKLSLSEDYNTNTLGVYLLFGGWSFLRICGKLKRHIWSIVLSVTGSAILLYLIMLTGSRKSTIGFVLVFLMWVLFAFRTRVSQVRRSIRIMSTLVLVASVVFVIIRYGSHFYLASDTITRRMQDLESTEGTWTIRLSMISDALLVFIKNPVIGVGLNNYRLYSSFSAYSHNTFVEVLACTGLLGGWLFFMVLKTPLQIIFHKTITDIKNKSDKVNDSYNITLIVAFLVICMTQICIYNQNLMIVLIQIMAISVLLRNNQDRIINYYEKY
jgi:O-antigen ligase